MEGWKVTIHKNGSMEGKEWKREEMRLSEEFGLIVARCGRKGKWIPLVDRVEIVGLLQDAQFLSASDSLASSTYPQFIVDLTVVPFYGVDRKVQFFSNFAIRETSGY